MRHGIAWFPEPDPNVSMVNRREFLGLTLGAGATMALTPELLRAILTLEQPSGKLIQRAIPSTGEMLPAVGLSFSNHPGCADHAVLTEVLKTFAERGGRVFDAMHVNPASEQFHITAATELGISNKLFWSTRGTPANAAPQPGSNMLTVALKMEAFVREDGMPIEVAVSLRTVLMDADTLNTRRWGTGIVCGSHSRRRRPVRAARRRQRQHRSDQPRLRRRRTR